MKCKGMILLAFSLATTALGFSQTAVSSSAANADANATAVSSSASSSRSSANNVNVVSVATTTQRDFTTAAAGASGVAGPIPGFAPLPGSCSVVWSPADYMFTLGELRSMVNGLKWNKKHMDISVRKRSNGDDYEDDDVTLMLVDYDARFVANKGDKVLADLVVPGKYLQADGKPLAVALLQAYEQTHARRFSVMGCSDGKNVTKGHSGGVGVTSSGINAAGNVGTSGSFGFNFGKSTSGFEGFDVLRVRALNRNGDLIELNESARHSAASPSPLPQSSTLPLPPVQTLRIEVVAVAPSLAITANTNLPAAATLPTPQTVPTDACAIPAFSAHFAYNHPLPEQEGNLGIGNILEGDRPQIAKMAEWLKNNPTCKVEVRGYASPEGDRIFNEGLGSRRARAVENALIAAGVSPTSMTHTSSGKDYLIAPGAEYYDADRRAIVQVLGPASGR